MKGAILLKILLKLRTRRTCLLWIENLERWIIIQSLNIVWVNWRWVIFWDENLRRDWVLKLLEQQNMTLGMNRVIFLSRLLQIQSIDLFLIQPPEVQFPTKKEDFPLMSPSKTFWISIPNLYRKAQWSQQSNLENTQIRNFQSRNFKSKILNEYLWNQIERDQSHQNR